MEGINPLHFFLFYFDRKEKIIIKIVNGNLNNLVTSSVIKPAVDYGISQIAELTSQNVNEFLIILSGDIETYLVQYNNAFLEFQRKNRIVRYIQGLQMPREQNKPVAINKGLETKIYMNKKMATQNFIQVLIVGKELLSKIRTLLTGQSITTNITIRTSDGVYVVDQRTIQDYITPVLSTYGGMTGNNPFSLAYQIDIQLLKEKGYLEKENKISDTNIYQDIWNVKIPYLTAPPDLGKGWSEKKARRNLVFNSKDAEIYNLMLQMENQNPGSTKNWLTMLRYSSLRASMGGGGGYRTSQLKAGDVGLIQDKMVSERQNSVNIIRQQMIKDSFEKLKLLLGTNNKESIRQGFLKIFTENEELITDKITEQTNKEAKKMIEILFK